MYILNSSSSLKAAQEELNSLPLDGTWSVDIGPHEKRRTNAQNRYWHKIIHIIADEVGMRPEDLKDEIKLRVFGVIEREFRGHILREVKSSASCDTKDMGTLINATLLLAHEMGINLPTN